MNLTKPEVFEKLKSCSIAWFEKYNQFLIVDGIIVVLKFTKFDMLFRHC